MRRFLGDFINFSDPFFFFISIFAAFAIQTKFIFSCDGITLLNHDGFGRNWIYCSSRFRKIAVGIKKYFLPKMRFHASFSNQLSRLSRFLKVLENRIRQYFITYNLKTWFWPDRNKTDLWNGRRKAFYFCRLRPADAIVSVLLSYDDIFLTEGCREKHLALIIRDKIRRA